MFFSPAHSVPPIIPAADEESDHPSSDSRRKPIDQKGAREFQSELKKEIEHS